MHFLTYESNGTQKIGLLTANGEQIIPLAACEEKYFNDTQIPTTMLELIQQGDKALLRIIELIAKIATEPSNEMLLPLSTVRILAPIPRPAKNIFCIGKNYAEHAMEFDKTADPNVVIPKHPVIFTKAPTTVIGPDAAISSHAMLTKSLDYEVELAVIIGKKGSYITKETAMDYIFGYTIMNDVTARDLQKQHLQWFRGKSLDGSAPMGPYLVHKSAIPNPANLSISSKVNGELRQNANTRDFIFDVSTIISTISAGITLEPGDIIATGTPAGVGAGFKPPKFLQPGDELEFTIEGLGTLKNTVI